MAEANENRENKFFYWLVGAFVTLVTAIVVIANGMVDSRIRNIELYGSAPMRERMSKIESDYNYLKDKIESIEVQQGEMMKLLQSISYDLRSHMSTERKRVSLREPLSSDEDKVIRLYSQYSQDFPLDLDHTFASVVAEKDEQLLGFGWLDVIVEANVILDLHARPRDKFDALRAIISHGSSIARNNGFSQMHVFPKDSRFSEILKKHLSFRDITGDCLVKGLG